MKQRNSHERSQQKRVREQTKDSQTNQPVVSLARAFGRLIGQHLAVSQDRFDSGKAEDASPRSTTSQQPRRRK